jgi:hypothetical protein
MLSLAEFYEAYNWVPTLKPSTPEAPSPDHMNQMEESDTPQEDQEDEYRWTSPVNISPFSVHPLIHYFAPGLSPSSSTTIPPAHLTDRGVLDIFLSSAPDEYNPSWPHNLPLPGEDLPIYSSPKQPAVPESSVNHHAPPSLFPDYFDYPSYLSDTRAQEDDFNSQKLTPSLFPSEWSLDSAGGREFIPDMFPP